MNLPNGLEIKTDWNAALVVQYFLGVLVFLLLVFSTGITIPFAHNDTWLSGGGPLTELWVNWQYQQCRPICAEINRLWLPLVSDLVVLSYVRAIDVVLLALLVLLTTVRLGAEMKISPITGILIGTSIFLLPSMQWAIILAEPAPLLALLFAVMGSFFAPTIAGEINRSFRTLSLPKSLLSLVLTMFLLYMSLFTYPAYTSFFLVPGWIAIIFRPPAAWPHLRKELLANLTMFVTASVTYFWMCRWLNPPTTVPNPVYRFELSKEFIAHIEYFLTVQMAPILNLWNIYPSVAVAGSVVLLIIAGVCIRVFQTGNACSAEPGRRSHSCQRLFALILIPMIMEAPFILGPGTYALRVHFCVTVLVLLLADRSIMQIGLKFRAGLRHTIVVSALCAQTIIAGLLANYNVSATAFGASLEFLFVSRVLFEHRGKEISRIHIVAPEEDGKGYTGLPTVDKDFNSPSLEKPYSAIPLVSFALTKMGMQESPILITIGSSKEPVIGTNGVVVIDANELKELYRREGTRRCIK